MHMRIGATSVCLWLLAIPAQAGLIHIGSQKQFFIDDYLIESLLATTTPSFVPRSPGRATTSG